MVLKCQKGSKGSKRIKRGLKGSKQGPKGLKLVKEGSKRPIKGQLVSKGVLNGSKGVQSGL